MIYSKHRFTLDMHVAHSQIAIPVTVGDTGKIFYINLSDGGEPIKIADGSLAMLTIRRPTGTFLQAFCPIKNNSTIVYDFMQNENTAVVEGIHNCELALYSPTSEIISTPKFTMIVSQKVVNDDSLNITDEDRNAVAAMIGAEASRQSAEEARINAETGRVNAEVRRETYYEDFVRRVNNGEFGGEGGGVSVNSKTITLSAGNWNVRGADGLMYELEFPGMTSTATVICGVAPNMEMEQEVLRCNVRCVAQEHDHLWFQSLSGETPAIDLDMNILVMR